MNHNLVEKTKKLQARKHGFGVSRGSAVRRVVDLRCRSRFVSFLRGPVLRSFGLGRRVEVSLAIITASFHRLL